MRATAAFAVSACVLMLAAALSPHTAGAYGAALVPKCNDPLTAQQDYLESVGAEQAWSFDTAVHAVTVAVIDTGVDAAHPDLAANICGGFDATDSAPDGQSRAQTDADGHGTRMAGIISACWNNGTGICGVSRNARIMPLKVAQGTNTGKRIDTRAIQRAYEHLLSRAASDVDGDGIVESVAREYNVRVVNLSIGSEWSDDTASADYELAASCLEVMHRADAAGILTVCAAGNKLDGYVIPYRAWPADDQRCLGVTSLDAHDRLSEFSNRGSEFVAAPGEDVLSTAAGGSYAKTSGASEAAAIVSGTAALMFSINPSLSPQQARSALQKSSVDLGARGQDSVYGYGKVNAAAAVAAVAPTVRKGAHVERGGLVFRVTKSNSGACTAAVCAPISRKTVRADIPAAVLVHGKNYKVTRIDKKAFAKCKKLKRVVVGKSVAVIGAQAFSGCKKLKTLELQTKKLKKAGVRKCLAGSKVRKVKAPANKKKAYAKLFVKSVCGRNVKLTAA